MELLDLLEKQDLLDLMELLDLLDLTELLDLLELPEKRGLPGLQEYLYLFLWLTLVILDHRQHGVR
jgi:hypothetical protein